MQMLSSRCHVILSFPVMLRPRSMWPLVIGRAAKAFMCRLRVWSTFCDALLQGQCFCSFSFLFWHSSWADVLPKPQPQRFEGCSEPCQIDMPLALHADTCHLHLLLNLEAAALKPLANGNLCTKRIGRSPKQRDHSAQWRTRRFPMTRVRA